MLVHSDVQEAVRRYHPDLVVHFNPKWSRDTNRFYICQRIRSMREVDERTGLWEEYCWDYPVLGVDQATVIDRRWFQALDENRWDNDKKDPLDMIKEESARKRKMIHDMNTDWVKDVGWWHWKKHAEQFSVANINRSDPTRKLKERQDRLGRDALL